MNKKVIFVHGYTASSNGDWYPNISKELDKLGVDYSIPDMPGGKHPHAKEWLEILDREVRATEKPIILVGHSLGTKTILLYLDKTERTFDAVILRGLLFLPPLRRPLRRRANSKERRRVLNLQDRILRKNAYA